MILEFLIKNNLIPYIAMVAMGYGMYFLWSDNIAKGLEIENAKKASVQAEYNMGIIQEYNEIRFTELSEVRKTRWKQGKQHGSF